MVVGSPKPHKPQDRRRPKSPGWLILMTTRIESTGNDIKIPDLQGFFQDFLRKVWKSDKDGNWNKKYSLYSPEIFATFWNCRKEART